MQHFKDPGKKGKKREEEAQTTAKLITSNPLDFNPEKTSSGTTNIFSSYNQPTGA